eukprot:1160154-Pelagomonas_calceolata.AAC.10
MLHSSTCSLTVQALCFGGGVLDVQALLHNVNKSSLLCEQHASCNIMLTIPINKDLWAPNVAAHCARIERIYYNDNDWHVNMHYSLHFDTHTLPYKAENEIAPDSIACLARRSGKHIIVQDVPPPSFQIAAVSSSILELLPMQNYTSTNTHVQQHASVLNTQLVGLSWPGLNRCVQLDVHPVCLYPPPMDVCNWTCILPACTLHQWMCATGRASCLPVDNSVSKSTLTRDVARSLFQLSPSVMREGSCSSYYECYYYQEQDPCFDCVKPSAAMKLFDSILVEPWLAPWRHITKIRKV